MTSYRNKYLELLKTDFGKKPLPQEPPKLTKINSVSFVSSQDRPVQKFHPLTMPKGSPAAYARPVTGGSSGAGPNSIKTTIPAAGCAGSVAPHRKTPTLATSAAYLKKTRR